MTSNKNNNEILKKDKIRLGLIIGFIFFCFIVVAVVIFFYGKSYYRLQIDNKLLDEGGNKNKQKTCVDCRERYLDGLLVERGQENLMPIAVMIENHIEARPPAGLANASLVYEAEAEGGITRFLAIFDSGEDIAKIGPIRSARSYYLDWVQEIEALFIHCGGSPDALVKILKEGVNSMNEFYQGNFFWRDSLRPSPHNVYTSIKNIKEYRDLKDIPEKKDFAPWQFKDDIHRNFLATSSIIQIYYLSPPFYVEWHYRKENNSYIRQQAGSIHRDETGEEIKVKNVIIQFVKEEVIDDLKRLKLATLGEGQAIICLDSRCREATWQKRSGERTRYYYREGSEVKFNRGTSWVEVVGEGYKVNF